MVEHPSERVLLSAPPGRDGWKFKLLAEQVRGEARKKWHDRSRLNQSASQGTCNLHVSSDNGVPQAGHPQERIAPQLERVAKAIVHPAQDDIDLLQPVHGLQIDAS